jgi:hypothetical protein
LWIYAPLSRYRLFASDKHTIIFVFVFCVTLRALPEIVAFPYPIGYDVVNYYIPVVEHFDERWVTTASQFPLYVLLLNAVQTATGLPAQPVVAAVAVGVFGFFGMSLYCVGRSLLKLGIASSVFVAIFVVVQMAVLRTAWDLHRDVFALAAMMLVFSLLGRNNGWKGIVVILALAALSVAADRMIGALLCISLLVYAAMTWRKDVTVASIFAVGLFSTLMVASYSAPGASEGIAVSAEKTEIFYDPQNLLILFAVVNGMLVVPAAVGFLRVKNHLLKIPLLVCVVGSFSWLAFPDIGQLVADRWVILAGIFLAVFAGYGILRVVRNRPPLQKAAIAGAVIAVFAAIGITYAVMPYDSPFTLYAVTRADTENFGPVTMQFSSLDVRDTGRLLSTIEWINQNTEPDAVIVGEKHWRGFMEVYLKDERTYRFSDDPLVLAQALERQGKPTYQITFATGPPPMFQVEDIAIR